MENCVEEINVVAAMPMHTKPKSWLIWVNLFLNIVSFGEKIILYCFRNFIFAILIETIDNSLENRVFITEIMKAYLCE